MPKFKVGDHVWVCCYEGFILPKTKATVLKVTTHEKWGDFYELNLDDGYNTWVRIEERFVSEYE